ncbi:MAG TPA: L-seryl-tRNA(Sec) selenium transferase [Blastocatellia bacterium]|jgi:L-seryl-tRNA(Ser) seleniumtransferase|nr:L-seryl-tRNA(Sec) selenium transferase [Blastocatellia bacterium]
MSNELLRSLPSIERLLAGPAAARLSGELSRPRLRDLLREITDDLRREVAGGELDVESIRARNSGRQENGGLQELLAAEIERQLEARAAGLARPSLRRVVNATGVVIHTNLGRAPLARAALDAISDVAVHYSNLEYDIERGERGKRESHCQGLLARLSGSESAIVANNNAAAVMLVLNTLAEGGEVIVSRGELVEIGGSFRIPDVMEKSGARLREVGTTNRTRIQDYERAINDSTRLILRVHPSNYRIIGFTERPSAQEISDLARRANIPSFEDLGSGCLIDLEPFGVRDEPVVSRSLEAGISVVSFSGDKMLGGPQAGIIAGSRDVIERVRKNPLMRALRVDKMTYAALEATLSLYDRGVSQSEVPVLRALTATREQVGERASLMAGRILEITGGRIKAGLEEGDSVVGGGSAPEVKLPTVLITIEDPVLSASSIEARLRAHRVPVIARTERDQVLLDLRTVEPGEESIILEALSALGEPAPKRIASI